MFEEEMEGLEEDAGGGGGGGGKTRASPRQHFLMLSVSTRSIIGYFVSPPRPGRSSVRFCDKGFEDVHTAWKERCRVLSHARACGFFLLCMTRGKLVKKTCEK